MSFRPVVLALLFAGSAAPAYAAANVDAGRDFVMKSCTSCHAITGTTRASDQAPPHVVLSS